MAVISANTTRQGHPDRVIVWSGIGEDDTCAPFQAPFGLGLAGAVQVAGTFGGATVALQVSIDGENYVTLSDLTGQAISLSAAGMREFGTSALYLRPTPSGTSGTTALTVTVRLPLLRAE